MKQTVLFLCPHHAAKSVIAAEDFNRLVQQTGLLWMADSAGTEPSEAISPVVAAMLQTEGIDVSTHQPRHVTATELERAAHIISMGCTAEELGVDLARIEHWNDVPMVSHNPEGARVAIRMHVNELVKRLQST